MKGLTGSRRLQPPRHLSQTAVYLTNIITLILILIPVKTKLPAQTRKILNQKAKLRLRFPLIDGRSRRAEDGGRVTRQMPPEVLCIRP